MKVAIYIRVSTEEQAREGYSLEIQREYLMSASSRLSGQLETYASHDLHSFMMGGRENSGKNAKCALVAQNEIPIP